MGIQSKTGMQTLGKPPFALADAAALRTERILLRAPTQIGSRPPRRPTCLGPTLETRLGLRRYEPWRGLAAAASAPIGARSPASPSRSSRASS
jgi:hypothetical protein